MRRREGAGMQYAGDRLEGPAIQVPVTEKSLNLQRTLQPGSLRETKSGSADHCRAQRIHQVDCERGDRRLRHCQERRDDTGNLGDRTAANPVGRIG